MAYSAANHVSVSRSATDDSWLGEKVQFVIDEKAVSNIVQLTCRFKGDVGLTDIAFKLACLDLDSE